MSGVRKKGQSSDVLNMLALEMRLKAKKKMQIADALEAHSEFLEDIDAKEDKQEREEEEKVVQI